MRRPFLPGGFVLRAASRLCGPRAVEHVVRPAVADLQHEFAQAAGLAGTRRTIRVAAVLARGYLGCCRALLWCLAFGVEPATNRSFFSRLTAVSLISIGLASGLLLWRIGDVQRALWDRAGSMAALHATLYLLPGALVAALPPAMLAVMLAGSRWDGRDTLVSTAKRTLTRNVALAALATGFAVVLVGWLVPAAHDAWRHVVSSYLAGPAAGVLLPRDLVDMTLPELWQLRATPASATWATMNPHTLLDLWIQIRVASAAACVAFAVIGLSLVRAVGGFRLPGVVVAVLTISLLYLEVWRWSVAAARAGLVPVGVGAWAAHAVLALAATAVWLSTHRTSPPSATS